MGAAPCLDGDPGGTQSSSKKGPSGGNACPGGLPDGDNVWDHLDYVYETICDRPNKTVPMDLSAMVGWHLYMGTHAWPDVGSGHGTTACVAYAK